MDGEARRPPGRFRRTAAVWALFLTLVSHWPVAFGKTPLNEESITNFPLYDGVRPSTLSQAPHAELGDLVTFFFPSRVYLRNAVRSGHLPLWNTDILLGAPFLADGQSAVFYPPNLLYLLISPGLAWALLSAFRTFLAVFLTAIFARRIGASSVGALAAGTIFAFCGFLVDWGAFAASSDAVIWLPLALISVDVLFDRPGPAAVAFAAIAFVLPVLAGHPEIAFYVVAFGCAYWASRLAASRKERGRPVTSILLFLGAGSLALALASIQLLPTVEFLGQLNRTLGQYQKPYPWDSIVSILCREHRSTLTTFQTYVPSESLYVGGLALLAAPLAFLPPRGRRSIFFLVSLGVSADLVYGWTPLGRGLGSLPLLRAAQKDYAIFIPEFCLSVLAGLGITAAGRFAPAASRAWARVRAFVPWAVFAALALGLFSLARRYPASLRLPLFASPAATLFFLLASAVLLTPAIGKLRSGTAFRAGVLAVAAADLVTYSYGHVPFVPRRDLFPQPAAYRWIKAREAGPYRVASIDLAGPSNAEMLYGMESPAGYDYGMRATARFLAPLEGGDAKPEDPGYFLSGKGVASADRRLDAANVKYLVATTWNSGAARLQARPERFRPVLAYGNVRVFENLRVLPRAFLVSADEALPAGSSAEAERLIGGGSFDFSKQAVVEGAPPDRPRRPPATRDAGPAGTVQDWHDSPDSVSLRFDAGAPSLLVISQAYSDGWIARVDGARAPLRRVDLALSGIFVPPGRHFLRMIYVPRSLAVGAAVSAAGLAVLAGLLIAAARRRA